jgi:hypothetical protein
MKRALLAIVLAVAAMGTTLSPSTAEARWGYRGGGGGYYRPYASYNYGYRSNYYGGGYARPYYGGGYYNTYRPNYGGGYYNTYRPYYGGGYGGGYYQPYYGTNRGYYQPGFGVYIN